MNFAIGDKVRVNDNYGVEYGEPDESILKSRGSEGVVVALMGQFVAVTHEDKSLPHLEGRSLYLPAELDKL